jgi:hypothetical protein
MTTSEQVASLMETLLEIRDDQYPEVPEDLLRAIVVAHAEDPDGASLHRRVQRALEESLGRSSDASD